MSAHVILMLLESGRKEHCNSVMPWLSCVETDRLPDNAVMTRCASLARLHPITCTATVAQNTGQAERPCPCAHSADEGLWPPAVNKAPVAQGYGYGNTSSIL